MKKAVVIGGSNGIGLSVTSNLIENGYHVYILDLVLPDESVSLKVGMYTYINCDLLNFNDTIFEELSLDKEIDTVFISAGFGRVAEFDCLNTTEIHNMLTVNSIAGIRIIRHFYDRIKDKAPFYCGIMGSIAGLVSSPLFSVYAASKAAICRFVESVNIELELSGTDNRILNVSPGSIKGTRFNGGVNDISLTQELAGEIVQHMRNRTELFIPQYEEVYKGVLERYADDPHEFGVSSYNYKMKSGRIKR